MSEEKDEAQKWNILMASIRRAAHILNQDLEERDYPDFLNWNVARDMHKRLWNKVYARNTSKKKVVIRRTNASSFR